MAKPKVTDSTGVARRRRRLRIWLAVLLTGTAVGLGLYFYPYPPLPAAETEAARTALQQARREAASLAPQPLARAVKAAVAMERLYAYDRSRWFRFTRLEALDRSIADTRSFAEQALDDASQVRAARFEQGERQRAQFETELELLTPDVKFLPPQERAARSAHARAELALAQAAEAGRSGNLALLDASLKAAQSEIDATRKTLGQRYERFNDPDWRRRWQGWVDDTVADSRGGKVAIVVNKLGRRLYLIRNGLVVAEFEADFGRNALSHKVVAGDGATPEGRYRVKEKRANGSTKWYKALVINYPNADDMKAFNASRRRGEIPPGRGPGSLIEIHGYGGKQSNWTDGCVALRDAAMDRLFDAVPVGTPVTIVGVARVPGDGTLAQGN